jgi:chemotaxis protein MotA
MASSEQASNLTTRQDAAKRAARWSTTDRATVVGLAAALVLMLAAIAMGGSLGAFIDLPAILIVVGGTLAVTTVSFSLPEMSRVPRLVAHTLIDGQKDTAASALDALKLAETVRKQGHPVLETMLRDPALNAIRRQAFNMVLDGTEASEIERSLRRELQATVGRHRASTEILRRAAEVAPAMGLIGTLIGLVQMLASLDKPAGIGPAMAVALLTTFYGAVLANMMLLPIAAKLERNSQQEMLLLNIDLLTALSIARQENPRRLETVLNSILPPSKRVAYFQ